MRQVTANQMPKNGFPVFYSNNSNDTHLEDLETRYVLLGRLSDSAEAAGCFFNE